MREKEERTLSVSVEISARHVHLCQKDVEILFGVGHRLANKRILSQPGQYAAREAVSLIGSRGRIDGVCVLGPTRAETQVEISMTDGYHLGVDPPVCESGNLRGSSGITLKGSAGTVELTKGVICAERHIHMLPATAEYWGLHDGQYVQLHVGGVRGLIFGQVRIRVSPGSSVKPVLHIDTDEGNAAGIVTGNVGVVVWGD